MSRKTKSKTQAEQPAAADTKATKPTKGKAPRTIEADAPAKARKTSALDAAAKVLGEAGKPMNCQDLIAAMTEKGYWTSPKGKTPSATLYAAIMREIKTKGKEARFEKSDRGQFALAR